MTHSDAEEETPVAKTSRKPSRSQAKSRAPIEVEFEEEESRKSSKLNSKALDLQNGRSARKSSKLRVVEPWGVEESRHKSFMLDRRGSTVGNRNGSNNLLEFLCVSLGATQAEYVGQFAPEILSIGNFCLRERRGLCRRLAQTRVNYPSLLGSFVAEVESRQETMKAADILASITSFNSRGTFAWITCPHAGNDASIP